MQGKRSPVVITALAERAYMVREAAVALGLSYNEIKLRDRNFIKFVFEVSDEVANKLATSIPMDVYAYRMFNDNPD